MKFYISYFYAVRFMKPHTIPLSTAVWDPFWFYKHQQGNVYVDKNGVMNGLKSVSINAVNAEIVDETLEK